MNGREASSGSGSQVGDGFPGFDQRGEEGSGFLSPVLALGAGELSNVLQEHGRSRTWLGFCPLNR
jgi:hypothetical protein